MKLQFSPHTKKNEQISNFMKIDPVGAKLFHVDAWTDRHDKANSDFSQFCKSPQKRICDIILFTYFILET